MRFVGRSDVGKRRAHNEDAFSISNDCGFALVCDGMGGHQCGEVASRLAVDIMSAHASESTDRLVPGPGMPLGRLRQLAQDAVVEWAKDANTAIFQKGTEISNGTEKRMGTTMVFMLMVYDYVILAHVGDSRIYRLRNRRLELLTQDHITRMRESKPRSDGKIRVKKYVTRALGTKPTVDPEVRVEIARPDDAYLMCSDGLTDLVKEKEIERLLKETGDDTSLACRSLIHLANKRGGNDNITVVIGQVWEDEDDEEDTEDLNELF